MRGVRKGGVWWVEEVRMRPPLNMKNERLRPKKKKKRLCGEEGLKGEKGGKEKKAKVKWKVCVGREERKPE